jgi:hypothetical protein
VALVYTTIPKPGRATPLPRLVVHAAMANTSIVFHGLLIRPLDMSNEYKSTTTDRNIGREKNYSASHSDKQAPCTWGSTSNQSKSILLVWGPETNLI